jgi:K+-sensing histidine kinase KdpD
MTISQPAVLSIIISALVALVVVVLTHRFTVQRETASRRREQRINYLVSVYRGLSKANNHPRLHEVADDLEQAISDIQLFGTPTQARLAREFGEALGQRQTAELDSLLTELRNSLREELGLPAIPERVLWLRVERGSQEELRHKQAGRP